MALSAHASQAEGVASGLHRFREPLPEYGTEITGIIADLFSISSSLKLLDDLSRHRHYGVIFNVARSDVDLVSLSLQYTLDNVIEFFYHLDGRRGSSRSTHLRVWASMAKFFMEESGETLAGRLVKYKSFLGELEELIQERTPDMFTMSRLREGFRDLLAQQDSRLARRLGAMSVSSMSSSGNSTAPGSPAGDRRPRAKRSYERARPPHLSPTPTSPSSGSFFDIPPTAPPVPGSPVTSSVTSHSLDSNIANDHWAKQVFFQPRTESKLPNKGDRSMCYGEPHPELHEWLEAEGFVQVLELPFSTLRVRFFLRDDDHRARIVCSAHREHYCLPLNMLEIVRVGPSCLNLCRRRKGGSELVMWANLKFSTMEVMTYFFCTFLALRSQDSGRPVGQIRDYDLDDEEEIFASPILDDDFLHALRVYRDKVSGAIRLQASVHKGEMKRAPVWTAFITHLYRTPKWIRVMPDQKHIELRELPQVVFTFPEYMPPKTQRGGHLLRFTSRKDAYDFSVIIQELMDGKL
ncbi:hypothetical protein BDV19DRAFT_166908 [Aspergillus venezuelensis]